MDFHTETTVFLAYAAGAFAVCLFGRFLAIPLKLLLKLAVSSVAGGAALFLINFIGSCINGGGSDVTVPLNMLTAALAGVLGIPGVIGMTGFFWIQSLF